MAAVVAVAVAVVADFEIGLEVFQRLSTYRDLGRCLR